MADSLGLTALVSVGAGFLVAVLWFDLMHDVMVPAITILSFPRRFLRQSLATTGGSRWMPAR